MIQSASGPETNIEQLEANLNLVVSKNAEFYREISDGTEPLLISDIAMSERGELIQSPAFQAVVAAIEWPTRLDRRRMTWSRSFEASEAGTEDFARAQLDRSSLTNFYVHLRATPADVSTIPAKLDFTHGMDNIAYGTAPALIRANVVAPELFSALRGIFQKFSPFEMWEYMEAHSGATDPLMVGMRTAYGLMGRCMRSDDIEYQARIMGMKDGEEPVIQDIARALKA